MLRRLFGRAFRRLKVSVTAQGSRHNSDDPAIQQDFSWRQLLGKRAAFMKENLTEATILSLTIIGVIFEPLRWLSRWFMRRSSVHRRVARQQRGGVPPVADLVWAEASPAVRVLQYLSQLASGRASRLRLVWGRACSSWEEFCDKEPAALVLFRDSLETAVGWTHYRMINLTTCTPWLWAGLVDYRRDPASRQHLLESLLAITGTRRELGDEWFHEEVLARLAALGGIEQITELQTSGLLQGLWLWAWEVLATAAQTEFAHGRNRARAHFSQSWGNFVAQCNNAENVRRLDVQQKAPSTDHRLYCPPLPTKGFLRFRQDSGWKSLASLSFADVLTGNHWFPVGFARIRPGGCSDGPTLRVQGLG